MLAYRGIAEPTVQQRVGARIEAEFMVRVIGAVPFPTWK